SKTVGDRLPAAAGHAVCVASQADAVRHGRGSGGDGAGRDGHAVKYGRAGPRPADDGGKPAVHDVRRRHETGGVHPRLLTEQDLSDEGARLIEGSLSESERSQTTGPAPPYPVGLPIYSNEG